MLELLIKQVKIPPFRTKYGLFKWSTFQNNKIIFHWVPLVEFHFLVTIRTMTIFNMIYVIMINKDATFINII